MKPNKEVLETISTALITDSNSFKDTSLSDSLRNSEDKAFLGKSTSILDKDDISDFSIDGSGIIKESWLTMEDIPSRIIEISKNVVILECLEDRSKQTYKARKVERMYLEGVVPIEINQLVLIKKRGKKGKYNLEFENGDNIIPSNYFQFDDPFNDPDIFFGNPL